MVSTTPAATGSRTNVLAIVEFVLAFVAPLIGAILCIVARVQIGRSGQGGRRLATAGVIIGFALTVFYVILNVALLPHMMVPVSR